MKNKYPIFVGVLMTIGFYILYNILTGIPALFAEDLIIPHLISWVSTTIIIGIIFFKDIKNDFLNFKKDMKGNFDDIITHVAIFFVLQIISNVLISYILKDGGATNQDAVATMFAKAPIIMGLGIIIFGPICEEFVFRLPFKNTKGKRIISYVLFSLIFAIGHILVESSIIGAILHLIPYFFLSLMIGYPFFKTNNIFSSILLHMINNTFAVLVLIPTILRG